ncbi:MAG: glycoside hydrolase family 31 protein [Bryobacteraceae bacterium]|nr:glycoside hydrolase family 31 protein [Bryobacteraceae bacterium]
MTRRSFLQVAAAVPAWNWDRAGARFSLPDGSGEIRFLTPSTFFVIRRWNDSSLGVTLPSGNVKFTAAETGPGAVELSTDYLRVHVDRATFRLRVTRANGELLLEEASPARRSPRGVSFHFNAAAGEEFLGLGPRNDAALSARSSRLATTTPFLISTAGFGLFHRQPGEYEYDLTQGHRTLALKADRAEYAFYYGPTPKDICEEHNRVRPQSSLRRTGTLLPPSATLEESVRRILHASLSGIMVPRFDADRFAETPLAARARQLALLFPWGGDPRFEAFFETYLDEARERGIPLIHPLPLQFPRDPEGLRHTTQFLLGDELLAAPILGEAPTRRVYLPMGRWTDLRTNTEHPGRRTIEIESPDRLPLFAKNGSIVPFGRLSEGPIELHYFPNLGAEFFLFEPSTGGISQVHAAPAGDYLRLEIESQVTRRYEWIIHHRGPAKKVEGGPVSHVRHDAARNNLHLEMEGRAGADHIVNITL